MQTLNHGGDIYSGAYRIDFSTSVNPLGVPPEVLRSLAESAPLIAHYPDPECRELCSALSDFYHLPAEFFLCSSGAAELIMALAFAVRPRRALLATPSFSEYEKALRAACCEDILFYECRKEDGFRICDDFLEYISEDIDMIYLCNPANPMGTLINPSLLQSILERCAQMNVILVLDECFNGLIKNASDYSMVSALADNPQLFILNAFTKSYAMAGLRLGYGISSNAGLMEKLRSVLQPWNVSIPAQMAGVAALRETGYIEEARRLIEKEMAYIKQCFRRMGIYFYDSKACFLCFEGPEDLAAVSQERGFLIRDCSSFRGLGPGYFRISVRSRRENEELCGFLSSVYRTSGHYSPPRYGLPEGRGISGNQP